MSLSPELATHMINKMKNTDEFGRFTSFKKNRNFILCSTAGSALDIPTHPESLAKFLTIRQDGLHKFNVGDIRIKFSIVPCPEATIISK
jgi:hypothetical protein